MEVSKLIKLALEKKREEQLKHKEEELKRREEAIQRKEKALEQRYKAISYTLLSQRQTLNASACPSPSQPP